MWNIKRYPKNFLEYLFENDINFSQKYYIISRKIFQAKEEWYMKLHYNPDGTLRVILNLKGKRIKMTFDSEDDYYSFLKIIS